MSEINWKAWIEELTFIRQFIKEVNEDIDIRTKEVVEGTGQVDTKEKYRVINNLQKFGRDAFGRVDHLLNRAKEEASA